jgi:hypothetical protein
MRTILASFLIPAFVGGLVAGMPHCPALAADAPPIMSEPLPILIDNTHGASSQANNQISPVIITGAKPAPIPAPSVPAPAVSDSVPAANAPYPLDTTTTPIALPAALPLPDAAPPPLPTSPVLNYYPVLPYGADAETLPQLLPVAANRPFDGKYTGVEHAIVAIHDFSRDANATTAMLMGLAGATNSRVIIVAPQFLIESDLTRYGNTLPNGGRDILRWPAIGGWESGGESSVAAGQKSISSFTALDELLLFFGEKNLFPDLKDIVIVGHGTGADFVLRYAAFGKSPDLLDKSGTPARFVAANASSYLYLTPLRPVAGKPNFATPDTTKCQTYDSYKYGLQNLNDYSRRLGANAARLNYSAKRITYMAGEKIAGDERLPDTDCAALLEGPDRLTRAMNYDVYLDMLFGENISATHQFATVPGAGYDAGAIFGSICGMESLFGAGQCKPAFKSEGNPR